MIGTKLLHYEITAQLGEGGMGVVYQATDTRLGREVAIKVLPEAFVEDTERLARFQREAQLLASLNHPNIGGIYGLEEDGARRFLVLELIPGETLAERLSRGAVPVDEALAVGTQIARALEAAHERGIVHRDLKPANIKITPDGTVKVLDFGLAKAWDQPADSGLTHSPTLTAQMTQAGVILGTASYMSPEQARGKPADKRADIWSFGVVLWEMLTGRKLFSGETVSDVLAAVLRAEPSQEDLPPSLPRGVVRVLERCLAKNPDERLHDIADARIELDEARTDFSSPTTRRERNREANRPWLRTAALSLLIALVAAAGSLYVDRRLGRQPAPPVAGSEARLDVHLGDLWIPTGFSAPSYLALSGDGNTVAFVGNGVLHVRSLDELEARALPGTEGASCPFFSPEGSWIGFEVDDKLKIVPTDGGGVRTLCSAPNMRGATWSRSGFIVFATGSGELAKVGDQGGEPEVLLSPDSAPDLFLPRWPVLLPDERHLLFTSLSRELGDQRLWSVHVLSLDTGERRRLLDNAGATRFLPPNRLVFARGGNDYELAGNLFVIEIDPATAELRGAPREALHGVHLGDDAATPYFDLSRDGSLLYSPTDPALPSRRLVWVDRTGAVESAFAHSGAYVYPRLSPRGTHVALAALDDIWVLDLERATETRITSSGTANMPIWTPDGSRLIFQVSEPEAGLLLYEAPAAGGPTRPVSSERAEFPNFVSPDGRRVNFNQQTSSAQWDLYELSLEEGGTAEPWIATEVLEANARLSPDGRWIAYRQGGEVVVRSYPDPGPATVVSPSGEYAGQPVWSPDGRELYYLSRGELVAVPVTTEEAFSIGTPRPLFDLPESLWHWWRSYDVHPDGERFLMLLGDPKETESLRLIYVPGWGGAIR